MEIAILVIVLIILAETTALIFKKIPTASKSRRKIYVDTSSLIDGRILDIARSGFIDGDLIILKSVLRELQLLADGKDSEKRNRARAGMENVAELERVVEVNTEVVDDGDERVKVDEELLKYARENKGWVLTLDYNLIKVAEAEKIKTLNINNLALALKSEWNAGDKVRVHLVERGSNRGQAVAHLPDGTMLVVDNAVKKIGQDVTVQLTRVIESPAGKMAFGKLSKD